MLKRSRESDSDSGEPPAKKVYEVRSFSAANREYLDAVFYDISNMEDPPSMPEIAAAFNARFSDEPPRGYRTIAARWRMCSARRWAHHRRRMEEIRVAEKIFATHKGKEKPWVAAGRELDRLFGKGVISHGPICMNLRYKRWAQKRGAPPKECVISTRRYFKEDEVEFLETAFRLQLRSGKTMHLPVLVASYNAAFADREPRTIGALAGRWYPWLARQKRLAK